MKENPLLVLIRNRSRLGKWLLSGSLLLVTVLGFFQLYAVQMVFYPEKYRETKITQINRECFSIAIIIRRLIIVTYSLKTMSTMAAQTQSKSPGSAFASDSLHGYSPKMLLEHSPVWQDKVNNAEKILVNGVRKLKYVNALLNSMQRTIEHQLSSNNEKLINQKLKLKMILAQIKEIQPHCRLYHSELRRLSEKLSHLVESSGQPFDSMSIFPQSIN